MRINRKKIHVSNANNVLYLSLIVLNPFTEFTRNKTSW